MQRPVKDQLQLEPLSPDALGDVAYVEAEFEPLPAETRSLVEAGALPQPSYLLPDGTPMVPPGHATLLACAEGDPARVRPLFFERFIGAGGEPEDAEDAYGAWLEGSYGVCLYHALPEDIVAKGGLMQAIGALLAGARQDDPRWRAALRGAVEALDALERPFADFDRERFGGPVSRDRLIDAPREQFPAAFADNG